MNRRYSVDWEPRGMTVNGTPVRSPLARFLVAVCTLAAGAAVVWFAIFVVLPIVGVTVGVLLGVVLAVIGGVLALLFAVPWVIALLAGIGLLKWLFGR